MAIEGRCCGAGGMDDEGEDMVASELTAPITPVVNAAKGSAIGALDDVVDDGVAEAVVAGVDPPSRKSAKGSNSLAAAAAGADLAEGLAGADCLSKAAETATASKPSVLVTTRLLLEPPLLDASKALEGMTEKPSLDVMEGGVLVKALLVLLPKPLDPLL